MPCHPVSGDIVQNQVLPARAERIAGLDTIRFLCALWVVFSHFGFIPLSDHLAANTGVVQILRGLYNNLFCGVAAVIVFFIISGFCIHFPFRNAPSLPVAAFLARRYLRIGLPFLAAFVIVLLCRSAGVVGFYNAILWSLVAEIIYYTLYPILFPALKNFGWHLVTAAYILAFTLICLHPAAKNYHDFGPYLTWAVGLPCWLLGCMLAKSLSVFASPPRRAFLWFCRGSIWILASLSALLRFHGSIGYPWTLNFFAIACFFWLRLELRWFRAHPPYPRLERAGSWSYSLYLCHVPAFMLFGNLSALCTLNTRFSWLLQLAACLLISYCFYRVVEYPAHRLAAIVGRSLHRKSNLLTATVLP